MRALDKQGITTAFPIQAATIHDALAGRDVLAKAKTGSGKTMGFGLPMIMRLAKAGMPAPKRPHAIVMVPTRELAMQVNDALEPYAHSMGVSLKVVAGGLSMAKQVQALQRGVHLIVATPGRLADLARRKYLNLSSVTTVVLDEADHMADMGFMPEVTEILNQVAPDAQYLLFSATLDGDVDVLVNRYMQNPVTHDVTAGDERPADLRHLVLSVPPKAKYQYATRLAARDGRSIVFVRTKLGADRVAEQMREAGVLAAALHGDKTQNERNKVIAAFRAGEIPVLVATDVAARGIHVDDVDLVLNVDPPTDPKDYTHRSGRTARAGKAGLVITFALPHQRSAVTKLMERVGVTPESENVRGDDAPSHAFVDKLTGSRAPSGQSVRLPPMREERREERRDRGGSGWNKGGAPHKRRAASDGAPRRARDDAAPDGRPERTAPKKPRYGQDQPKRRPR